MVTPRVQQGSSLPPPTPPAPERIAIEVAIRLGLLSLCAFVAWRLVSPFVPVILWATVSAVALYPAFEWLRDRLGGRPWLAAVLVTIMMIAITAGPALLLVESLVVSVETLAAHVGSPPYHLPPLPKEITGLPVVGPQIAASWDLASSNVEAVLTRYGGLLIGAGERALRISAGIGVSLLTFSSGLVAATFLYPAAPRLMAAVHAFANHVIGRRGDDFVHLASATIRTVARGVIGVAMIQALLIGFALIVAHVPAAGLLTLAALLLCIVQVGALPIVVPIIGWAWLVRDTGEALFLTAWLLPAALSDNLLKPLMMAKRLTTPILVILIGVVGGTIAYGLTGLFLGPLVLAVFYDLVRFWLTTPGEEELHR